jgi:hypothetical protein
MPILYEKKEKIAIITINRPEAMNALDPETSEELGKAWTGFRDDPDQWVAILTGGFFRRCRPQKNDPLPRPFIFHRKERTGGKIPRAGRDHPEFQCLEADHCRR